jgi:YVTN family beta-propeller protein
VVGSPIAIGATPFGIAITPDGRSAYVTNYSAGKVSMIDTQAKQMAGLPIGVGMKPSGIAITPDGREAFLTNGASSSVSVIDTETNQVLGSPITVGTSPSGIAITPDGRFAYVAIQGSNSISVIDTQTNQVVGSPIPVGEHPDGIAITPDGRFAYVVNGNTDNVSVIDTQTNQVFGTPTGVGHMPNGIAITPDGRFAYVTNEGSESVSVIDTQTNHVVGTPITVGAGPTGIAIAPDQPPVASFSDLGARARPGVPLTFSASASSDPDGSIARYAWQFGDGQSALEGGAAPSHTYAQPGTYQVKLTLTDNEDCSTALVFTGQTAACNGRPSASMTQAIEVAFPGVRVKCPGRSRPRGCKIELQAVSKKHGGQAESALARAKAKAGKAVVVGLQPKAKFLAKLAAAKKILVREKLTIKGAKRTSYRRLAVVR